jgi:hypothetical protein
MRLHSGACSNGDSRVLLLCHLVRNRRHGRLPRLPETTGLSGAALIGMTRIPEDDFDHPRVPEGPLRPHVLYRLRKPERRGAHLSGRRG